MRATPAVKASALARRRQSAKHDFFYAIRALKSRNYRLFFAGQGVSLTGTRMQQIAMTWFVYKELTGESPFALGLIAFCSQIPNFFLAPLGGVIADRADKHKLIIALQACEMLQAIILTTIVFAGVAQLWHIVVLSLWMGVVGAFETPIRQSFVVVMVGNKEDLPNAIALNSTLFNGARLIGPSLAGLMIAKWGVGVCFASNAISYFAVLAALIAMKPPPHVRAKKQSRFWRHLWEGVEYTASHKSIRTILLLLLASSLIAMPYITLLAVFADKVIGGGATTFGYLTGAVGIGALAGAVFLATMRGAAKLAGVISTTTFLFGISLILFSLSSNMAVSLALMMMTGFAMMTQVASCNTLVQTIVDDDKRGRVMSHYVMIFIGIGPVGSLAAGWIAEHIGAPLTVGITGTLTLILGALMHRRLRAIGVAIKRMKKDTPSRQSQTAVAVGRSIVETEGKTPVG
ncbi:MFS transporter [soil metagenome]